MLCNPEQGAVDISALMFKVAGVISWRDPEPKLRCELARVGQAHSMLDL